MTVSDVVAKLKREPVVLLTLVVPILALLASFGLSLSEGQTVAIGGVVAAITSLLARSQVTPVDPGTTPEVTQ